MTPEEIQAEYTPLIAAAMARDAARFANEGPRRNAALLDAPFVVCGIPLRAMTLVDYLALLVAKNAHVTLVDPPQSLAEAFKFWTSHDFAFLWLFCPEYQPDAKTRDAWVARHAKTLDVAALQSGLTEYLADTFADAPEPPRRRPGDELERDPIGCSFAVSWQHQIAEAYGWSRAEIRALPLKELFQILRMIKAAEELKEGRAPRAPLAGEADRLWAEMLHKINSLPPAA